MAIKLNWQRRSIVMLAVFTLVLGFILTTLAVREAERERLSQEKNLDGEQQRYASLLAGEIDSLFSEMEGKISAALSDVQTQQDIQKLSEACRLGADNEALFGDIFLVDGNNDLVLPLRSPLFLTSERRRLAGINLEKIESIGLFKTAESAELITNNLPFAIQSYKTLVNRARVNSSKALVLNRLARCYMKSGNFNQALLFCVIKFFLGKRIEVSKANFCHFCNRTLYFVFCADPFCCLRGEIVEKLSSPPHAPSVIRIGL